MKKCILLAIILISIAAICAIYFITELMAAKEEASEYTEIQNTATSVTHSNLEPGRPAETADLPYMLVDFEALVQKNPDTVGWIHIPDTLINYPVVQATNNSKYLSTSFSSNKSSAGAVFADMNNDVKTPDQNVVLYGHNMGSGRKDMFGTLLEYKECAHYDAHRYIQFDTIYEQHGWWKVLAVLSHDIRNVDWNYLQLRFETQDDFLEWISQAKDLSLYDTDTKIQADDHVLTLSTCDRSIYGKNGRLVILAVKMGDENT
jgi:sortase B